MICPELIYMKGSLGYKEELKHLHVLSLSNTKVSNDGKLLPYCQLGKLITLQALCGPEAG